MGTSFNLLIHGNPGGFAVWYNRAELREDEVNYLKSFYTSDSPGVQGPLFRVDRRQGNTYYHYLLTQGIQERGGRISKYVALTLRLGQSYSADVAQIFALLDGLFRNKAIGTLVEATAHGYRFLVEQFAPMEQQLLRWEQEAFSAFSATCRFGALPASGTRESSLPPQSYSLDDLLDRRLQPLLQKGLQEGCPLLFAAQIPSQRLLEGQKELRTFVEQSKVQIEQQQMHIGELTGQLSECQQRLQASTQALEQHLAQTKRLTEQLAEQEQQWQQQAQESRRQLSELQQTVNLKEQERRQAEEQTRRISEQASAQEQQWRQQTEENRRQLAELQQDITTLQQSLHAAQERSKRLEQQALEATHSQPQILAETHPQAPLSSKEAISIVPEESRLEKQPSQETTRWHSWKNRFGEGGFLAKLAVLLLLLLLIFQLYALLTR